MENINIPNWPEVIFGIFAIALIICAYYYPKYTFKKEMEKEAEQAKLDALLPSEEKNKNDQDLAQNYSVENDGAKVEPVEKKKKTEDYHGSRHTDIYDPSSSSYQGNSNLGGGTGMGF